MCKEKIEQLEVGDKVVIYTRDYQPYKVATVEKLTMTQLTIDGERFNRRNGVRIGDGDSYSMRVEIAMNYFPHRHLMTVEEAETANLEKKQEQQVKVLAAKITNTHISYLKKLPLETLQQVIKLLQLEEETNGKNT